MPHHGHVPSPVALSLSVLSKGFPADTTGTHREHTCTLRTRHQLSATLSLSHSFNLKIDSVTIIYTHYENESEADTYGRQAIIITAGSLHRGDLCTHYNLVRPHNALLPQPDPDIKKKTPTHCFCIVLDVFYTEPADYLRQP